MIRVLATTDGQGANSLIFGGSSLLIVLRRYLGKPKTVNRTASPQACDKFLPGLILKPNGLKCAQQIKL